MAMQRILLYAAILAAWQLLAGAGILNDRILPSPSRIAESFLTLLLSQQLLVHVAASMERVLVGFFLSVLVAVPLALLLSTNSRMKYLLLPLVEFIRPVPPIAWIPLAIMWFGIGSTPSYFVTMIASFFPIFINTVSGVENVSREHLNVARCFGLSDGMLLRHVILPSSLPYILSGMRVGLGVAWMSVVAAEMIAAFSGLGYMITISQEMLQAHKVLVGMITIGVLGFALDNLMLRLKRGVIKWA